MSSPLRKQRPPRPPFIGSGRLQEAGALATRKQDFNAHTTGVAFRHDAYHIDMNPILDSPFDGYTVQDVLKQLACAFLENDGGWVAIGGLPGSDGYAKAQINVGSTATPTLEDAFAAAFLDARLVNGGIILLKAGTYTLTQTITVPQGITIIGDPTGTYIVGEMSNQPMFEIQRSEYQPNIGGNAASGDLGTIEGARVNGFYNINLVDNIEGNVTSGGIPIPTMTTVPMISALNGCNVLLERVNFFGLTGNTPPFNSTYRAIRTSGVDNGFPTTVRAINCYFDGVSSAIELTSLSGEETFLQVESCRIRAVGDDTSANNFDNAAISFNACNAQINSNYLVLESDLGATIGINIKANAVTTASSAKIAITANTGKVNGITSLGDEDSFVRNDFTDTLAIVNNANNWGSFYNNQWYVTVGDGATSLGDLNGVTAIDFLIVLSNSNNNFDLNVIVLPGNYTVTESLSNSRIKLIGNPNNGNTTDRLPEIDLLPGVGVTDPQGLPAINLGERIENIRFTSFAGAAVIVNLPAGVAATNTDSITSDVKNCVFSNVALSMPFDRNGNQKLTVNLFNCHFYQNSTPTDFVKFYCSSSPDFVNLQNCTFNNFGYGLLIGEQPPVPVTIPAPNQQILLKDCIFNLFDDGVAGTKIRTNSPLTPAVNETSYISIRNTVGDATLENCTVIGGQLSPPGRLNPYNAALLGAVVNPFIHLSTRRLKLINCNIQGPNQFFISGPNQTLMPTILACPQTELIVDSCRIQGGFPLQVTNAALLTVFPSNLTEGIQLVINNSNFLGWSDPAGVTSCLLNLDLPSFNGILTSNVQPSVHITDCDFQNQLDPLSPNRIVNQINNTGLVYDALAAVQIYAPGWYVNFDNNNVNVIMGTNLPLIGLVRIAGVLIDTLGDGVTAWLENSYCNIQSSDIQFFCNLATASLTNVASCILTEAIFLNIENNRVQYTNTLGSTNTNVRSWIYLNNPISPSTGNSTGIVSNNSFTRIGTLSVGGIAIEATSNRGLLVDNHFDNATIDGATNTALVVDASALSLGNPGWIQERNVNQTFTEDVRLSSGRFTVNGAAFNPTITGATILVHNNPFPTNSAIVYDYVGGSGVRIYQWLVPLKEVLPGYAQIISAEVVVNATQATLASTLTASLVQDATASFVVTADLFAAPLNGTITLTPPSGVFQTVPNFNTQFILNVSYNSASNESVSFSSLSITYRY